MNVKYLRGSSDGDAGGAGRVRSIMIYYLYLGVL
ncbi:hypothetical protein MNSC_11130 [Minisyncoccus archaeophilus]|jgi:hypothetical protein